eukprot:gene21012-40955_t
MALLVFAVMGVSLYRGSSQRSLALAAWVAAAGWLTFHFWPSLGLHAEIPGMDAARLGSRQGWWVLAAGSAALACVSVAVLRSHLRWVAAAAWLALPYVIGAPQITADPLAGFSGEAQATLRQLGSQFIWATTWVSLSFWVSMGLAGGLAFQRWVRPALLTLLQRTEGPAVGTAQAPQKTRMETTLMAPQPLHFHAPHKTPAPRPDAGQRVWTVAEVQALLELPFNDLMFQAQTVHRQHFDPNMVELATLLSVKTGGCPEDCGYCSQSARHESGLTATKLMDLRRVLVEAKKAREAG